MIVTVLTSLLLFESDKDGKREQSKKLHKIRSRLEGRNGVFLVTQ